MLDLSNVKKILLPEGRAYSLKVNNTTLWYDKTGEIYNADASGLPYGYTELAAIIGAGELQFDSGYVLPDAGLSVIPWGTIAAATGTCELIRHGYESNALIHISARTVNTIDGISGRCTANITGRYSGSANNADEEFSVTDGETGAFFSSSWARNASFPSGFRVPENTVQIYVGSGVKLHSINLRINSVLIFRMVPCLDRQGIPCLFDTVSKNTFYNIGSGTAGYELPPEETA